MQSLLFSLGYAGRDDNGIVLSATPLNCSCPSEPTVEKSQSLTSWDGLQSYFSVTGAQHQALLSRPTSTVPTVERPAFKVCVLGDNGVGKSSLVWNLSGLYAPGVPDIEKGASTAKSHDTIVVGGAAIVMQQPASVMPISARSLSREGRDNVHNCAGNLWGLFSRLGVNENSLDVRYLCLYAVPRDQSTAWLSTHSSSCDVVLLMFDSDQESTFHTAKEIEKQLPPWQPRIFVGSKTDLYGNVNIGGFEPLSRNTSIGSDASLPLRAVSTTNTFTTSGNAANNTTSNDNGGKGVAQQQLQHHPELSAAVRCAALHVEEHDLLPVLETSIVSGNGIEDLLNSIRGVLVNPKQAVPLAGRQCALPSNVRRNWLFSGSRYGVWMLSSIAVISTSSLAVFLGVHLGIINPPQWLRRLTSECSRAWFQFTGLLASPLRWIW
jgi:GTPase SAR1 family protein